MVIEVKGLKKDFISKKRITKPNGKKSLIKREKVIKHAVDNISIGLEQSSVCIPSKENTKLTVKGRHDPCILPRAVPCVEAAAAIAIYDMICDNI